MMQAQREEVLRIADVRVQLKQRLAGFRLQIEHTQVEGKIPADYSLGFINGLIFVDAMLDGSNPKFYDRKGSIGQLPVPVALRTVHEQVEEFGASKEYEEHPEAFEPRTPGPESFNGA